MKITRRDFLKETAAGAVALAVGAGELKAQTATQPTLSQVVLVRSKDAVKEDGAVNSQAVAEMVETALKTLTGEADAAKAWAHFVKPEDMVGIKFTRCDWMRIPSEQAVIDAVAKGVESAKVPKERIIAQDGGLPAEKCTALINLPSVKVHSLTGIAVSLKNYINFSPNPSNYHFAASGNLAEIWNLPQVKGKTRLIVVDILKPYFGPGPQINPTYRWHYGGVLVSTDPVAADTVCLKICQAKRNLHKGEEWPITPPPVSVAKADTVFGLGTNDWQKIKLTKLGWDKDLLV